jgi:YesN/AraC family two-component response regulator
MPRQRIEVEKIREILRLHQELKFSVRKIANALQISKTSVGEYLAEFRLHSQNHITNPTLDIKKICKETGFSNHSYFSKCFRKYYKMSPKEYINQI